MTLYMNETLYTRSAPLIRNSSLQGGSESSNETSPLFLFPSISLRYEKVFFPQIADHPKNENNSIVAMLYRFN